MWYFFPSIHCHCFNWPNSACIWCNIDKAKHTHKHTNARACVRIMQSFVSCMTLVLSGVIPILGYLCVRSCVYHLKIIATIRQTDASPQILLNTMWHSLISIMFFSLSLSQCFAVCYHTLPMCSLLEICGTFYFSTVCLFFLR